MVAYNSLLLSGTNSKEVCKPSGDWYQFCCGLYAQLFMKISHELPHLKEEGAT